MSRYHKLVLLSPTTHAVHYRSVYIPTLIRSFAGEGDRRRSTQDGEQQGYSSAAGQHDAVDRRLQYTIDQVSGEKNAREYERFGLPY